MTATAEHLDGCPMCMRRDNPPQRTTRIDATSIECTYECDNCQADWHTSWWSPDRDA